MLKYIKEHRFYILLFFFLLIPIVAIDTATRSPRQYRLYDKAIISITAPIQSGIRWTLDEVTTFFENYLFLIHTKKENHTLLEENRNLIRSISELKEKEQENNRLRSMLQFKEKIALETSVARVISKDVSTEFRAVRINRGENSGVKRGMAVLTSEGIVGRVFRTTGNTADVLTIVDLLSAVDAIVQRSRARGIVEGLTDEVCQLRFALRTDDIQPGDLLITSGLGGIFPKGVPVGTVSKVNKKSYGVTQEVEIRPAVDFSKLEEVLIVTQIASEYVQPDANVGWKFTEEDKKP